MGRKKTKRQVMWDKGSKEMERRRMEGRSKKKEKNRNNKTSKVKVGDGRQLDGTNRLRGRLTRRKKLK